jgi:hypothetical protein
LRRRDREEMSRRARPAVGQTGHEAMPLPPNSAADYGVHCSAHYVADAQQPKPDDRNDEQGFRRVRLTECRAFLPAAAAQIVPTVDRPMARRDGGQKMLWAEPLHKRSTMGIEWRATSSRGRRDEHDRRSRM